jgi:hypothetical protein
MTKVEYAGRSNQKPFLQRISLLVFLLISLVAVPTAAVAALVLGIIICLIVGIEHTDAQTRVCLIALVTGFVGMIYLLVRARRPSQPENHSAPTFHDASSSPPSSSRQPLPDTSGQAGSEWQIERPQEFATDPRISNAKEYSSTHASSANYSIDATDYPNDQARMRDWAQCWKAPVFIGGTVFVISLIPFQGDARAVTAMIWVSLSVALCTLLLQLRGIHFDRGADRLSYPMYCFRRSTRLSEIDDANCQTRAGEDDPFSFVIRLLGHTPADRSKSKRYIVNLSGGFGARRVVFQSKYKRDQFLSLLRSFAPQARITRWS